MFYYDVSKEVEFNCNIDNQNEVPTSLSKKDDEESAALVDFFFKNVPMGLEPGAKEHPSLAKQIPVTLFFGLGTLAPLNPSLKVAISNNVALSIKNLLRTVEQFFENKKETQEALDNQVGCIKYNAYFKYAILVSAILTFSSVDWITQQQLGKNYQLGQTMLGISLKTVERELRKALKGKKVTDETGTKKFVGPSLKAKTCLFLLLSTGALVTASLNGSPVLADSLLSSSTMAFKFLTKEIKNPVKYAGLCFAITAGFAGDYLTRSLSLRSWQTLTDFVRQGSLTKFGSFSSALGVKVFQSDMIKWQIGEDDEEEEDPSPSAHSEEMQAVENKDPSLEMDSEEQCLDEESIQSVPETKDLIQVDVTKDPQRHRCIQLSSQNVHLIKQIFVVTFLASAAFSLIYYSFSRMASEIDGAKQSASSTSFITNTVANLSSRMAVNVVQQLKYAPVVAVTTGALTLGAQAVAYPFEDDLEDWQKAGLVILGIFGARLVDKAVKNFQLGRKFSLRK